MYESILPLHGQLLVFLRAPGGETFKDLQGVTLVPLTDLPRPQGRSLHRTAPGPQGRADKWLFNLGRKIHGRRGLRVLETSLMIIHFSVARRP